MKKTRRLSIELEHRELTVVVHRSSDSSGSLREGEAALDNSALKCLVCGCPDMLPFADLLTHFSGSRADLSRAFASGEVHLANRGTELWLCQRSFEIFKETK